MMLTGRTVPAEEALRIGLVSSVAGGNNLRSKTDALAQEIAQLAPLAIRACIQAVTRGLELPLDQGLSLETELFTRLFATQDMREGTRAFLEKRVPAFKGT
jgi:enoyl-CoA hydratase